MTILSRLSRRTARHDLASTASSSTFAPRTANASARSAASSNAFVPLREPNPLLWPPQPAKIFAMLERAGGAPVSVPELIEGIWGDDEDGGPLAAMDIIKTQICRIRKRLAGSRHRIVTVPRRGYRLVVCDNDAGDPFASVAHGMVGERPLPPQEAAILRLLLDRVRRFVTREDIAGRLWPEGWPEAWRRIVIVLVARVRWKLETVGYTLKNQRGSGWRLIRIEPVVSLVA